MTIRKVAELLNAQILCNEENIDNEVMSACGCDLMSDALAYVKDQGMLITGLNNIQVMRTAEMLDMRCVVFVRGKRPDQMTLDVAKNAGMVVIGTNLPLYTSCGILYSSGLAGGVIENV